MSSSQTTNQNAIVLLSGGLDSATILAIAKHQGYIPHTITFRYGQRHHHEIEAARTIALAANVAEHHVADIDLRAFGGSALTADIDVPKNRNVENTEIPITYVPARNTIFLAYALAYAETRNAIHIFIGVNAVDYSGYPDCRPEFLNAFQNLARLATKAGVQGLPITVHAPLLQLSKAEIIARGLQLGVDYALTRSCYDPDPDGRACGQCDSCQLRKNAFQKLGQTDPAPYQR